MTVITHWLRASTAHGICASSADHPAYGPGFRAAHERAGHTVTRHSLEELRQEWEAREAARTSPFVRTERSEVHLTVPNEVFEALLDPSKRDPDQEAARRETLREARAASEAASPLPLVGTGVEWAGERGEVVAVLAFKTGHAYAGRRAVLVRYRGGETLLWPGQFTVATEPQPVEPTPEPIHVELVLFETRRAVYVQESLF